MPKLHELLAVMQDLGNTANTVVSETRSTFSKRQDHFRGQTRSVRFFDETRAENENTTETKEMVTTVAAKLQHTFRSIAKHWDALFQLERTNQMAVADLVVDGKTLAENVPATFLLGMESRLKELRSILLEVPTLPPELSWERDPGSDDTYVSPPQSNFRTEKVMQHKVLYDATDKHPAQIEKWTEDKPVAKIETVHRSGMLTPAEKSAMLARTDTLLAEVKRARQRANTVEVDKAKIAEDMLGHILG